MDSFRDTGSSGCFHTRHIQAALRGPGIFIFKKRLMLEVSKEEWGQRSNWKRVNWRVDLI